MAQRSFATLVFVSVVAWLTASGLASVPQFWRASTQADFLAGDLENLSVGASGLVTLGPAIELVHESASPFLWDLVESSDGALWLGSGNDGRVVRMAPDGTASTTFDADELAIHALTAGSDGSVYAASSPDGRLYRIEPDGTSRVVFDPDDRYIWTLVRDAGGTIYAGTGEKGLIYRITPDGIGTVFYDTKATHVTALAFDSEGRLLAGTESPGRIFRIDADGTAFVLLESGYQEIHSLRVDARGAIFAAAVTGRSSVESSPAQPPSFGGANSPTASVSTEITITAVGTTIQSSPSQNAGNLSVAGQRGAVFRIAPDGVWDTVWASDHDSPYDITVEADGSQLVGTGASGKIYRVSDVRTDATLVTVAGGQQVTRFVRTSTGRLYFTTANPGKLFRFSEGAAREGMLTSKVLDGRTIATWGSLRWTASTPAGSRLEFFSRSGNTATPDDTWSPWAGPYTDPAGQPMTNPKARYLQWRARYTSSESGAGPGISSVTAAYVERNLRPEVTSVSVHPPGLVFQQPFTGGDPPIAGLDAGPPGTPGSPPVVDPQSAPAAAPLGRRIYRQGLRSFGWTATDPNDDQLEYEIWYRADQHADWTRLQRGLAAPVFAWDTTSVPDGTYIAKIVASDHASNAPGAALDGTGISERFQVDNTAPTIEVGSVRQEGNRLTVRFTVRDAQSAIQRVEFAVGSNDWRVVYPVDGIPDSRAETYQVVATDARRIIIRATDEMNNVVTGEGQAPVGGAK